MRRLSAQSCPRGQELKKRGGDDSYKISPRPANFSGGVEGVLVVAAVQALLSGD